ncbi:MAG: sterol desaturase family protein [Deltaproteobacteria bacterium]|nr:sterol desaturase family protein [Deltaproteobacteria bacterium]
MIAYLPLLLATFAVDGLILGFFIWAFHSDALGKYRIMDKRPMKVAKKTQALVMGFNLVFSVSTTFAFLYFLADRLMTTAQTPVWMICLQALGVLVVYDFIYYGGHRLMHNKKLMRYVHGVHHRARYPSALESLYLSPIETFVGLALLVVAALLVGPVHVYALATAFFVYSTMNIMVHSGLLFPSPLMKPFNVLAKKHFHHHWDHFDKNYSSLTPLPDLVFRSAF